MVQVLGANYGAIQNEPLPKRAPRRKGLIVAFAAVAIAAACVATIMISSQPDETDLLARDLNAISRENAFAHLKAAKDFIPSTNPAVSKKHQDEVKIAQAEIGIDAKFPQAHAEVVQLKQRA
mmetsp:Transcript_41930/g.98469  ORF Transcript_41930/g.98469 Transcript_41930/m.98469 type:complete len:122 (+) Transcript_41930:45-410(+)|eukprot:CAMPEP_0117048740 /NCGR_PEP_ID=MMETSP0472-20121206/33695_1 /TAXON_ID=693140 ORGANISM="Tiarina fusus, Strain LIS" /NCGR_SAMPLE_ID=MMETSP0472 /ASSEMBLY_ACC=CAM_ASM_000603 /LENGTH=121 /DNA_ID=CAMNT_0004761961 /DNA_START=14 /DNA_END=379 /DNA_ORIENTATION=+